MEEAKCQYIGSGFFVVIEKLILSKFLYLYFYMTATIHFELVRVVTIPNAHAQYVYAVMP